MANIEMTLREGKVLAMALALMLDFIEHEYDEVDTAEHGADALVALLEMKGVSADLLIRVMESFGARREDIVRGMPFSD